MILIENVRSEERKLYIHDRLKRHSLTLDHTERPATMTYKLRMLKFEFASVYYRGHLPASMHTVDVVFTLTARKEVSQTRDLIVALNAVPRHGTVTLVLNGLEGLSNNMQGWEDLRRGYASLSIYLAVFVDHKDCEEAPLYTNDQDLPSGGWVALNPTTNPHHRWALLGLTKLVYTWRDGGDPKYAYMVDWMQKTFDGRQGISKIYRSKAVRTNRHRKVGLGIQDDNAELQQQHQVEEQERKKRRGERLEWRRQQLGQLKQPLYLLKEAVEMRKRGC